MIKSGLFILVSLISLLALPSQAQLDPILKAEAALQKIKTLQADFTQISSDGQATTGRLYLRRPFQMRIDYAEDNGLSLVATKIWLHVDDKIQKDVTSYPISETPFAPILQEQVILRSGDFETSLAQGSGVVQITLAKETGEAAGKLVLEFDVDSYQLRRWIIEDAVGVQTIITLQNIIYDQPLKNALFATPAYDVVEN